MAVLIFYFAKAPGVDIVGPELNKHVGQWEKEEVLMIINLCLTKKKLPEE